MTMTILEIKDAKTQLLEGIDGIYAKAETEQRNLSLDEQADVDAKLSQVQSLNMREKAEAFKSNAGEPVSHKRSTESPKTRYSIMQAINDIVEGRSLDETVKNVNSIGKSQFRRAGGNVMANGQIQVPTEVRSDILAGTSTQGQEIVAEDKKAILPPLVDSLVLAKAGATILTGLVGDVSIPSYAGTTVAWKTEVEAAADGGGAFSEVTFSPKRLTAVVDVSKQFLLQDSVGAEALLLSNISAAVARKLESTILGVAAGSATQPQGMGYKITTGTDTKAAKAAPTWASVVGMESNVDSVNALAGNLAYITNSAGRGILKTTPVATSGTNDKFLCEGNEINGYPLYVTNSCSAAAGTDAGELLLFGNWADLCICQWGGYDITVDPYTVASEGQVRIVINAYFDAKGLRGSVATDVHGDVTTDSDNYAYSFDSLALTA